MSAFERSNRCQFNRVAKMGSPAIAGVHRAPAMSIQQVIPRAVNVQNNARCYNHALSMHHRHARRNSLV